VSLAREIRWVAMRVHRLAVFLLLSQSLLLSFAAAGWVVRLMRRMTLRGWWRRAGAPGTFEAFAGEHASWPRWFRDEPGVASRRFLGGLRHNLRTGAGVMAATWLATMPACLLWAVGWYAGWDNSFHKGYEQWANGMSLVWLGIALFIASMLYVPLAQARLAATGEWHRFFEVRLVTRLAFSRPRSMVALAVLYTAASAPITVLRIAPAFFAQQRVGDPLTRQQVVLGLDAYYLFVSLVVLVPAYLALRVIAARIYASAIADGVRAGRVAESELAPFEREQLGRLGLLAVVPAAPASAIRRRLASVGASTLSAASACVLVMIWFSFTAQVFVLEFFHFHGGWGWLNQPLVHLPWIRMIPGG
jgi:hypothetical protein